jgi:hypothetical protein
LRCLRFRWNPTASTPRVRQGWPRPAPVTPGPPLPQAAQRRPRTVPKDQPGPPACDDPRRCWLHGASETCLGVADGLDIWARNNCPAIMALPSCPFPATAGTFVHRSIPPPSVLAADPTRPDALIPTKQPPHSVIPMEVEFVAATCRPALGTATAACAVRVLNSIAALNHVVAIGEGLPGRREDSEGCQSQSGGCGHDCLREAPPGDRMAIRRTIAGDTL